jgi:Raf kinase inhibitor-like YbhB/YbcL family protein
MNRGPKGALLFSFGVALLLLGGACSQGDKKTDSSKENQAMNISVTSAAFKEGESIPLKYTCDGDNISPPLRWSNIPEGTRSITIICDDPDAPMGTWVHWVLYDLPPDLAGLEEAHSSMAVLPNGAKNGLNGAKQLGYAGPCPPPGGPHRYFFKIYALDVKLDLKAGADKSGLLKAMGGHVLAEGRLIGTYKRQRSRG